MGHTPQRSTDHTKENFGVYGQVEYDLTQNTTLTAGVRWSDETIEGDYLPSKPFVAPIPDTTTLHKTEVHDLVTAQNPGGAGFDANGYELARQVSQKLENDDIGFSLKLDHQFGEDSLV